MRLDNKGWSLNTLLICIVVLLLFLMLAIFNAYKLSSKLSSDFRNSGNINNITDSTTSDDSTINNNDDSTNSGDSQDNNNSAVSVPEYYKTKESQLHAATIRYLKIMIMLLQVIYLVIVIKRRIMGLQNEKF